MRTPTDPLEYPFLGLGSVLPSAICWSCMQRAHNPIIMGHTRIMIRGRVLFFTNHSWGSDENASNGIITVPIEPDLWIKCSRARANTRAACKKKQILWIRTQKISYQLMGRDLRISWMNFTKQHSCFQPKNKIFWYFYAAGHDLINPYYSIDGGYLFDCPE